MKTIRDIPGYDAKATFFTSYDGKPVTYEMSYTDGECVSPMYRVNGKPEQYGYHCWHRGSDGEGDAFCCRCNATRLPLPDEPSH